MALIFAHSAPGATVSEREIKLAVVYRLAKFVAWPDAGHHEPTGDFSLCVDERRTFEVARERLRGRTVREQPLRITLVDPQAPLPHCDLLYLANLKGARLDDLLVARPPGEGVLTVGDAGDFTDSGGIVQLVKREKRIRMQINVDAARRAGLDISSQLLSLADLVDDRGQRL